MEPMRESDRNEAKLMTIALTANNPAIIRAMEIPEVLPKPGEENPPVD